MVKKSNSKFLSDEKRFQKILEIFPEIQIENFTDHLLYGFFYNDFLPRLDRYREYSKTITSEFFDSRLEKRRKDFNEVFHSLLNFTGTHLFPDPRGRAVYRLYPELKMHPQKHKIYEEYVKKLGKLSYEFYRKYKELIRVGVKIIYKNDEKKKDEKKFPHRLPSGITFENIIIEFLDEENVMITVGGHKHKTNYKEMGFEDKRNSKPNKQWILLKILAKPELGGELTLKDPEADKSFKKCKEFLVKTLQNYFKIDYDPFYPYHSSSAGKRGNSYKIKIVLIPQPETKQKKIVKKKDLNKEIEEYYKEQTPEVFDEYQ